MLKAGTLDLTNAFAKLSALPGRASAPCLDHSMGVRGPSGIHMRGHARATRLTHWRRPWVDVFFDTQDAPCHVQSCPLLRPCMCISCSPLRMHGGPGQRGLHIQASAGMASCDALPRHFITLDGDQYCCVHAARPGGPQDHRPFPWARRHCGPVWFVGSVQARC